MYLNELKIVKTCHRCHFTWLSNADHFAKLFSIILRMYQSAVGNYRPHPKDGEGNVLTHVCLSVHRGRYLPSSQLGEEGYLTFQVRGYLPSSQQGDSHFFADGGT